MRVRVLGTLEVVTDDGAQVALASPKLRRLLAALVISDGSVVSADRLADVVWGDDPPGNATGALHNLLSRLRGRLRSDDTRPVTVATRAPGYAVTLDPDALDAARFAVLVERARAAASTDPTTAVELYDEALALWRGEAYAEFDDEPFARAEAARLGELRATATEERIEALLALDRTGDAIAGLELLIGSQPLRERPQALLMVALYRAGRQTDALAAYRRYRDVLDTELGLEPSGELRTLEQQILRGDPQLGGPSVAPDLSGAGTPTDDRASPPSTSSTRRVALPPAPELVGRDRLVSQVCVALDAGGPVTLTGTGGVGKTSVALRSAALAGPDHRDGPWWCDLASVETDDAVAELVMTMLRGRPRPGMTAIEGVVDVLRPQRGLLALDNAEHVIDAVARLVTAITRECRGVTVLVTSRERLGVAGERVMAVPPLWVPSAEERDDAGSLAVGPAVELFVRRAAAASAFALTADNVAAVTDICRRLDGVPLALELAATRMRSMTPSDLAARLSWRFRVLRGGRRGGAERHRTLRAVVDWSYDLLDERARQVFDRLSVFAGAFTLDAAERVVADASGDLAAVDVADAVADLVDASMVVAHTGDEVTGYALLDTLRAYGREQLAARGQVQVTRRAHAVYHVELAEQVTRDLLDTDPRWPATILDRAIDELRAAHAWSLEHDPQLALRLVATLPAYVEQRALGEAYAWAERAVEVAERAGVTSPALTAAYGAAALSARFRGDLAQAMTLAERGLAVAAGPDDPASFAAWYTLSEVALYEGRFDEVRRVADHLAQVPTPGQYRILDIWAHTNRVLVQAYGSDPEPAVGDAERFLASAHEPVVVAWATYNLAETLVEVDPDRALPIAEEALARARAADDRFLTGVSLVTAASLHARHGDPVRAVPLFRETVGRWHRAGNWPQQWVAVRSIVGLLLRLGVDADAAVLHGIVSSRSTASPPYGADARRLDEAHRELARRLGDERLGDACARGAAMRDDQAITWIDDLLDRLDADRG